MSALRTCRVARCNAAIRAWQAFCDEHWDGLSREYRGALYGRVSADPSPRIERVIAEAAASLTGAGR